MFQTLTFYLNVGGLCYIPCLALTWLARSYATALSCLRDPRILCPSLPSLPPSLILYGGIVA